jgi:hypothetical protein
MTYSSGVIGDPSQSNTSSWRDGDGISSDRVRLPLFEWRVDIGIVGSDIKGLVNNLELVSIPVSDIAFTQ